MTDISVGRQDNDVLLARHPTRPSSRVCPPHSTSLDTLTSTHIKPVAPSPQIQHTTCPMPLVKSFPRMRPKSMGLTTSLRWKLTLRAPSRRWSNNVPHLFSSLMLLCLPLVSGPERNDGLDDAGFSIRDPRRRRSHELRRDHEVARVTFRLCAS